MDEQPRTKKYWVSYAHQTGFGTIPIEISNSYALPTERDIRKIQKTIEDLRKKDYNDYGPVGIIALTELDPDH